MKRLMQYTVFIAFFCCSNASAQEESREGWISVIWGDHHAGEAAESLIKIMFSDADQTMQLIFDDGLLKSLGGIQNLNARNAQISGISDFQENGLHFFWVTAVWFPKEFRTPLDLSGSQPWISLPMKFLDIAEEPENQTFFQNMYANTPGGLDHFWREVSYDQIDVVGSTATNWYTLPQNQSFYVSTPGSGTTANLSALFDDTISTVDTTVNFSESGSGGPYAGINMMFNGLLDCCAWGGSRFATIDGVTKSWRVTWEPPWGYADEAVIAHEMGHGFGLPHANNFDGDTSPYDNPWDVMSAAQGYTVSHGTYGRLGKHVCAYHKDILGWYPAGNILTLTNQGTHELTLDHAALSSTPNYLAVKIPYGTGPETFYMVETRKQVGNYDGNVPANAVLIYQVVTNRSEPAWLFDEDNPPADYADNPGSYWVVGETFIDNTNEISISVLQETTDGFVISVQLGDCDPIQDLLDNLENWPTLNVLDLLGIFDCF